METRKATNKTKKEPNTKVTIIFKVYGCDTEGRDHLSAEFSDVTDACTYAVAQYGKIHYNLPKVCKYIYHYNKTTQSVITDYEKLDQEQIYYLANVKE